jgi:Fe-S-cluster containining protein
MTTATPVKTIRRKDLKRGDNLCEYCVAKCCRYFALPIDTPSTFEDFEFIRWYLLHGRASVFTDEGDWYLLVHTQCKHIRPDYRCGIYPTRPKICQDYTTDECEYDDDSTYQRYFETPEQIYEYTEAVLSRGRPKRSARPPLLPVIR